MKRRTENAPGPRRAVWRTSCVCAVLLASFGVLEWLVLLARAPGSLSWSLMGTLIWSPLVYGAIGAVAGTALGLTLAAVGTLSGGRIDVLGRPSGSWAVGMSGILGFYWLFAANRLHAGHSRAPVSLALDALGVLLAVALCLVLLRRTRRSAMPLLMILRWSLALVLFLWLPFYVPSARPAIERTRVSREAGPRHTRRAPSDPARPRPNILLIMMDTTRADCLGCYGSTECPTPNIDRLAGESVLFEQCIALEPLTRPMACTIFTGLHPRTHGVDTNTKSLCDDLVTLAELLRDDGYATAAFAAASVLSGYYGTSQGFELYTEPSEPWWYIRSDFALRQLYISLTAWRAWWVEIRAGEVSRRVIRWMRGETRRPFFVFVHYFDPHAEYRPPAEYDLALREGLTGIPDPCEEDAQERFRPGFRMPRDYLRMEWLRYLGEIAYVDASIGQLLDALHRMEEDDDTIVILVGDHGESFEHDYYFAHGNRLYDTLLRVPLLVKLPGILAPGRIATQVRMVDLFPTVLSLVGIQATAPVQGEDLVPAMLGTASAAWGDRPAFCQTDLENPLPLSSRVSWGVRLPPWKYIDSPEIGLAELYNIQDDPAEVVNLAQKLPGVRAGLAEQLEQWKASTEAREVAPTELSPERRRALEALGYVQ